jgi:hypothetical protein
MFTRVLFTMLGVWLFFSGFFVPQSTAQVANTVIVGVLATACGVAWVFGIQRARYAGAGLALWLFGSTLALSAPPSGPWVHHTVVAALLIITALFPAGVGRWRGIRPRVSDVRERT